MALGPPHPKAIEALGPPKGRKQEQHMVSGIPGISIVVTSTGTKTWSFRYSVRGVRRRMALGRFPEVSLKRAKDLATAARLKVEEGTDPLGEIRDHGDGTMGDLWGNSLAYLEREVEAGRKSPRTLEERRRILARRELDRLRRMPPAEVEARDIARALDPIEERGSLVALNRTQAAISAAFAWALARHRYGIEANPAHGMGRRNPEAPRDRVLSEEEIRAVWAALEAWPDRLNRTALKLILLLGRRPGEVRRMRWAQIQGDRWLMEEGFRKGTRNDRGRPAKAHTVPLSTLALKELDGIRGRERNGLVFPDANGGFRDRQTLARVCSRISQRLGIPRFRPHDLRRTARTGLGEIRVDAGVAEKIVGHALQPILRVYDRGPQMSARAEVLERWAAHLAYTFGPSQDS